MSMDERLARLEEEGEKSVREKFLLGLYGQPGCEQHLLVEGWLQHKEEWAWRCRTTPPTPL